ncbi:hypothetical protein SAMN05216604_12216 [Pseudomonas agarici]|nr:hypothetical protein SAMN05216604_12216 [Pseudomonas agarici]
MRAHSSVLGTGLEKMAFSVVSCLLFMVLKNDINLKGQTDFNGVRPKYNGNYVTN